jgi:hypothetical protein
VDHESASQRRERRRLRRCEQRADWLAQPGSILGSSERHVRQPLTHTERGPRFIPIDSSLFKNVPLGDNPKKQLRVEIYNVINRLHLPPTPAANFLAPGTFGQFFNTFGRAEGFGTSRQIQFAERYLF